MSKLLVYPVILHKEDNGYSVTVPDIPGTFTEGDTQTEAINMAADAIGLMPEDEINYPKATPLENLKVGKDEMATLVPVNMD